MVRTSILLLLATAMGLTGSTVLADDEPPPQVLSRRLDLANSRVHDAILPGLPLDVAPYPGGGVAVLILPEDGTRNTEGQIPRALYRIQGAETDTTPVVEGLPEHLSALLGRGGTLWLGGEDRIFGWPLDGRSRADLKVLLELEGVDLATLKARGLVSDHPNAPILIPEVGRLNRYAESSEGIQPEAGLDLPVRTRRRSRGFELWSPAVVAVDPGAGNPTELWATRTEALGAQRLSALLIRPDAAEDERLQENWFRFETPEDVEQHHWVQVDGRTALIAITTPGDKLGIFQKLKLRVFYTGADRTRAGRRPTLAVQTVSRRWYAVDPSIHEVTGDGKDDLVLIQQEGMGGNDLVIDVYPGKGTGRFEDRRPKRTKLKDQGNGDWDFGNDFNADGSPDLALVAGGSLRIYAVDSKHKRKVLRKEPFFSLSRESEKSGSAQITVSVSAGSEGTEVESFSARGRLRVFDTDGNAKKELVLMRSVRGRAVIRVIAPRI